MPEFIKRSRIEAPAAAVFAWHERPEAFSKLVPPWEPVQIEQPPSSLRDGARVVVRVGRWPLRFRWVAEHVGYENHGEGGGAFTDVQVRGPMKRWEHRHLVEADGPGSCILTDRIEYELPLGAAGRLAVGWLVWRKLARMFEYRHRVMKEAMETGQDAAAQGPEQAGQRSTGGWR